jgi:hypothetical protein
MKWRVIITDTESMTGVAPVCEDPSHAEHASAAGYDAGDAAPDAVFDCCPHPHIETWNERTARVVAVSLTDTESEPCS